MGGYCTRHYEDKKKRGVRIRWLSGKSKCRQASSASQTLWDAAQTQQGHTGEWELCFKYSREGGVVCGWDSEVGA